MNWDKQDYVKENMNLVYMVIHKQFKSSVQLHYAEMESAGMYALVKAMNKFDSSKGFAFSTYASNLIRNEILMYFRTLKAVSRNNGLKEISLNSKIKFENKEKEVQDLISSEIDIAKDYESKCMVSEVLNILENNFKERDINLFIDYNFNNLKQQQIANKYKINQAMVCRINKRIKLRIKKIYERV